MASDIAIAAEDIIKTKVYALYYDGLGECSRNVLRLYIDTTAD